MLVILNSFKNNLALLQRKLIDKDPLVAHDLLGIGCMLLRTKIEFQTKQKEIRKDIVMIVHIIYI